MCIRTFFWCLKSFISKERVILYKKRERDNSKQWLFGDSKVQWGKSQKLPGRPGSTQEEQALTNSDFTCINEDSGRGFKYKHHGLGRKMGEYYQLWWKTNQEDNQGRNVKCLKKIVIHFIIVVLWFYLFNQN